MPPISSVPVVTKTPSRVAITVFLLVSGLYFADTCLRASMKTFWMDELFTVYVCRLPSFHATWTAVMRGCDFNPPLFYLFTRGAEHLFGEGLIATRLPSILGFWVSGVCLYSFLSRRLGRAAGGIAALFPFFTLAYTYAFEARAHGFVLAWSGLMLVCWQRAREKDGSTLWPAAFFLSFLAALLTHVYAVYLVIPYAMAEAYDLIRKRRLHAGMLLAMILAPALVVPLYLRMIHAYRGLTAIGGLTERTGDVIQRNLVSVLGPALLIFSLIFILLAWKWREIHRESAHEQRRSLPTVEVVLAIGFVILPMLGILTVRIGHGPFFDRYFLAATTGYSILLAQMIVYRGDRALAVKLFAAMVVLLLGSTLAAARYRVSHTYLGQVEPSSHFAFSSNPAQPLAPYASLLRNTGSSDVLITADPLFLYLHYYAPPALRQRLVFGAAESDDVFLKSYRHLVDDAGVDLRTTTFSAFFATHNDFFVYGADDGLLNGRCFDCLNVFLKAGYTLRSVDRDDSYLLEHFSR